MSLLAPAAVAWLLLGIGIATGFDVERRAQGHAPTSIVVVVLTVVFAPVVLLIGIGEMVGVQWAGRAARFAATETRTEPDPS